MTPRGRKTWVRNVGGLQQAATVKSERTRARVEEALRRMTEPVKPGQPKPVINFNTVAAAAGVSTAWLYGSRNKDIADRIRALREQQAVEPKVVVPASVRMSDASREHVLAILRARVKTLEEENTVLRKQKGDLQRQLEVAYGLVHERL